MLFAISSALITSVISFVHFALASDAPVAREELIAFLHDVPLTEGALHGFPNTPIQPSIPLLQLIRKPDFRGLVRRVSRDPNGRQSPEWFSNAALLELLEGDLDSAVNFLQRAIQLRPTEAAPLQSDLAAVFLEEARSRQEPYDLLLAFAAAAQACREGGSWEARFNRALALEHLHLDSAAQREWRMLLTEPISPELRQEIQRRWWSLRQPLKGPPFSPSSLQESFDRSDFTSIQRFIRDYPQEVRSFSEENLLAKWAQLHDRDSEQAGRVLALVETIGADLNTSHRDRMLLDAVHAIRAAGAGFLVQHLVAGHWKFAAGHAALKSGDYSSAQALLKASERELAAGKSPFFRWAGFYRAVCSYRAQDIAAAEEKVANLAGSEMEPYPVFEGRLRWLQGLLRISRADWASSLQAYLRSMDLFEKAGESGNIAAVSSLIAEDFLRLGQKELAWKYRERALDLLRKRGSTQFQTIVDEASEAAFRDGQYELARYFQDEVVGAMARQGTAHEVAEAYLRRIAIQVRLGASEAAEADFRTTMDSVSRIPDPALRARLEADALIAICEARLRENPNRVLVDLDQALSLYQSINYRFRGVDLRRLRALANEALGNLEEAEAELNAGAQELEVELKNLRDDLRESYLRQATPFFDEKIRVAGRELTDPLRSLVASEKARVLALPHPDRALTLRDSALWLAEAQKNLSEGTLLLMFRVLDQETLVWSLTREDISLFTAKLGKAELDAIVDRMNGSRGSRFQRNASILYERLIRPAVPHSFVRIILVPDKDLWSVPFPALYDMRTGHFLIEDAAVVVAPCASLLFRPSPRARRVREGSILAVGDAAFDRGLFPALPSLPGSRLETESAASAYRGRASRLLTGEEATVEAFMKEAASAEIVHFSGHAVETEGFPMLLLAPTRSRPSGVLTAKEVALMALDSTRLVVLAGCRTARSERGEGLASLSAAFLAAGVPEVVGSLWQTQDDMAAPFFREFHQHVAAGESGETALRLTQLETLSRDRKSKALSLSWAGYEVWIGHL